MTNQACGPATAARRDANVWAYVSPSRLNLWLKCPLAFRLKYIDGVPLPTSKAQFLGRRVHHALEHFYRRRQFGLECSRESVDALIRTAWEQAAIDERVSFDNSQDEQLILRQARDLIGAYLDQLGADEARPLAVESSAEAPLVDPKTGEDLGIPLVGVVDLVLDESAGPLVVDFKTASRGGEVAANLHELQLTSYAYLFRYAAERHENALEIRSLVKTKIPKIEYHRFATRDERHFSRLFAVIRAYLDSLDSGNFIYRPGLACGACEFRDRECADWPG